MEVQWRLKVVKTFRLLLSLIRVEFQRFCVIFSDFGDFTWFSAISAILPSKEGDAERDVERWPDQKKKLKKLK